MTLTTLSSLEPTSRACVRACDRAALHNVHETNLGSLSDRKRSSKQGQPLKTDRLVLRT